MQARLQDNLAIVRRRIADAAARSGRVASDIKLVAVTKYVGPELARALVEAGCVDLGESRPQELWRKAEAVDDPSVRWHLIGHLQRNKVKRTLPLLTWFHACDSRRLFAEVEQHSARQQCVTSVLVEVNISADSAKHGFAPSEVAALLEEIAPLEHVRVRGLMAMASLAGDQAAARADFAHLRQLRDDLRGSCPDAISLDELSMGMSRDFELAIEEGATMVRVGSALYEGLNPDYS